MFRPTLELDWQSWDGRPLTGKLLVRIDAIRKTFTWFGVTNSPSVEGWQPDPCTLRGEVLSGPPGIAGRRFALKMPGRKAEALTVGTQASLALAAHRRERPDVVVGVATVPPGAAVEPWLAGWRGQAD